MNEAGRFHSSITRLANEGFLLWLLGLYLQSETNQKNFATPIFENLTAVDHKPTNNNNIEASFRGKSSLNSQFKNPNLPYITNGHISVNKHKLHEKPIDHQYIYQILSSKDWFLLLNHEFKVKRISLNHQLIVSILQNRENPLHPLKFYIWVSNIDPVFARNQSIRGVLVNSLYRKGPLVLSIELIRDIRSSGCQVTEDLFCILIGSWGRLGLAKYRDEVFGQISYLGLSPTTRLYNAVIDAVVKSNSLDLAYLKFQQMPSDNCNTDRFTYNILIHGVCKAGVVDEAMRLLKKMDGLGYSPNVFTYTILIDGFCNAKRVDGAFRILEKMWERNVSPNEATYRSLVNGVFRCLSPQKAFQLLSRFVEGKPVLPKVACDTILHCLSNNSLPREAAEFLKKASERVYFPDSSTFNVTITCFIKGLDLEETCKILDGFIDRDVKVGFNTFLLLTEALYKSGRDEEGTRYSNKIIQDGLVANVFSYNIAIDCFSKAKMMDRALETFKGMQQRSIAPNLVTFNTLISGFCKTEEVGKARELLEMLLEQGFRPDIFTFSSIIDGLCRVRQIKDAFDCFTEMPEWGIIPNAVTYNILIRSLCIVGDVAKSMKLLKQMQDDGIRPDIFSFNALIQSFCKMNKIEKAQKVLITMLTSDLSLDNFTYCAFIKALCESGRFDEATNLFFSMEANGCVPDAYTYHSLIDALVQSTYSEEAKDIVKKCKERGIML
ncbi:putative pentatricopeptide repeat-containing protein At3g16890, mitochondrial [Cornus florida]|uniref:putative pentatricopeptide repeat-containing protein At3g16890, mitochondrial n=1 Tax=Cornus florida TaxID=4283 RepID=UPI00289A5253|nr:putative pentatricopeptide repeat-containing protein At3g16890, mitochondrial [Cornus florida]